MIWIWMENHGYGQIIGNPAAGYITALAHACGLATEYSAVGHPSLPNYLAATSGSTWGITDDNPPASHPLAVASLFQQAPTSASYEESMPTPCDLASSGLYAVKHNPEAYYTAIRAACTHTDLPLGTPTRGPLHTALTTGALPAFSFITPNLCHDMHNCATQAGDHWLATWIPAITASPSYQAGQTVIFITWDENDGSTGSNHVPTIVISPSTRPGTTATHPYTHYSLLKTTERLLNLLHPLQHAATAPSMQTAFNL